jgi:DnaJ-class molecular chaperone
MRDDECRECRGHVLFDGAPLYPGEVSSPISDLCATCFMEHILAGEQVPLRWATGDNEFAVVCEKCSGSGIYIATLNQRGDECNKCGGGGYVIRDPKGVQRTGRWWATYQANRVVPHG